MRLYPLIYDFDNLYRAFKQTAKNKRYTFEVLRFRDNLEENLINIQNHLIYQTYTPSSFRHFYIRDPKKRLISAPAINDRVVHHALCNIIEPFFEKRFIYDSYACRVSKGTHRAVLRVQSFINDGYVLKCDVASYFPSIDHQILLKILSKTIKCYETMWLIQTIVNSYGDNKGLPIGALTSQLFANAYLDVLDHYIKDNLGIKKYVRYMDDFVIIHKDKKYLMQLKETIKNYIADNLALTLNPKTTIYPTNHGIDFCGYRIYKTHLKMRKRNIKRAKRRFRKFNKLWKYGKISLSKIYSSLSSFIGYAKMTKNKATLNSVVSTIYLTKT